MVLLFHIMWIMRNLQLLSRTRTAEQDRGLFLFWRWRRFCAVKLRPIGQPPDSGHQCAYRPGKQRGVFFFFVALRGGFLVAMRVGRVGHERWIPQSLLGCREFSFKALRLGFPGGGAGTPRGSLLLVFQLEGRLGAGVVTLKTGSAVGFGDSSGGVTLLSLESIFFHTSWTLVSKLAVV